MTGISVAQTSDIVTGRIVDEKNQPIGGATVAVVGTNVAVTTGRDGKFSIQVKQQNANLRFTYVGFETKDAVANTKSPMEVVLQSANNELDEIVVIGYGTARKRDLTGAVGTVKTVISVMSP